MTGDEAAILARIDALVDMIRNHDPALVEALWGDGDFVMVGSETGEICRTRDELAAKIGAICASPATFVFDFPRRSLRFAGSAAWVFAEGTLTRHDPDGGTQARQYLLCAIFERAGGAWRWRQFFGSEPY